MLPLATLLASYKALDPTSKPGKIRWFAGGANHFAPHNSALPSKQIKGNARAPLLRGWWVGPLGFRR